MIIIIGAGLSGLLTAYRLKQEGIPFKILEARTRIGGRINTVSKTNDTPLEMGATWFGDHHKHLLSILEELEMEYFEQFMKGTVFFQPFSTSPAESIQIPTQPPSYRISGGTSNLINTLYKKLDEKDVLLNQSVSKIQFKDRSVKVFTEKEVFEGDKVILALPPKLWAKNIHFEPKLPQDLMDVALQTHTWMEDSIKIGLTYNQAFWEEKNLSGTLFSNTGPITEFYDHCNHARNKYALCGFINSAYKQLDAATRKAKVIEQVKNVFGEQAEDFLDYEECVWSREEHTFTASNNDLFPHQNNGNSIFGKDYMDGRLLISSSEAASEFPGYMDGAVLIANTIVRKIITAKKA